MHRIFTDAGEIHDTNFQAIAELNTEVVRVLAVENEVWVGASSLLRLIGAQVSDNNKLLREQNEVRKSPRVRRVTRVARRKKTKRA